MEARANEFDDAPFAAAPEGRKVLEAIRHEIEVFRQHGETYSHVFLVLQA